MRSSETCYILDMGDSGQRENGDGHIYYISEVVDRAGIQVREFYLWAWREETIQAPTGLRARLGTHEDPGTGYRADLYPGTEQCAWR